MTAVTVRTNGQTLLVNASVSYWTSAALALVASSSDDVESTTWTPITADTTLYFANTATAATVTVKQPDGTTIGVYPLNVQLGVGPYTLDPLPSPYQVGLDTSDFPWGGHRTIVTGKYYGPLTHTPSTSAAGTGVLTMIPFWSPTSWTADRLAVSVTTGAGSAVARLGIYGINKDDEPSTLLLDAGTVDASSTAVVEATISYAFRRGLYYLAAVSQVASATLRTVGTGSLPPVATSVVATALSTSATSCYYKTGITGALADVSTLSAGGQGYKVMARAA